MCNLLLIIRVNINISDGVLSWIWLVQTIIDNNNAKGLTSVFLIQGWCQGHHDVSYLLDETNATY